MRRIVIRSPIKLILILLVTIMMIIPASIIVLLRIEKLQSMLVLITFKTINLILGLSVECEGDCTAKRPALLVSNHCSYTDIFLLGGLMPISFTPKSEIKYWPLIGWCCVLAGCVFVERKPSKISNARKEIHKKLEMGRVICLFAEGTTNNGNNIKPFKSGLFSLAEGEAGLLIQPVTIIYTHRNGDKLDATGREKIAWYGDDTLMPHLIRFLSARSLRAKVIFHEPVSMASFDSRKTLCKHCETTITESFTNAIG